MRHHAEDRVTCSACHRDHNGSGVTVELLHPTQLIRRTIQLNALSGVTSPKGALVFLVSDLPALG